MNTIEIIYFLLIGGWGATTAILLFAAWFLYLQLRKVTRDRDTRKQMFDEFMKKPVISTMTPQQVEILAQLIALRLDDIFLKGEVNDKKEFLN